MRATVRVFFPLAVVVLLAAGVRADAAPCPLCGCEAGHCGAGIAAHLACPMASPAEKQRVKDRLDLLGKAVRAGLDTKTKLCNQLVQAVARGYGYRAFDDKTADEMLEYLIAPDGIQDRMKEGWTFLSPDSTKEAPKPVSVDEATQFANAGFLVIGFIHSKVRNEFKPKSDATVYEHGHAFVVESGGKAGGGFQSCKIANAGGGSHPEAQETYASKALYTWEQPLVSFWVLRK